jgi:glycosyltransferase involved in cell wall biosynthesis
METHAMKIVAVNNYYYLRGGAERVMFNDMQALGERGLEVVPFSAKDSANTPSDYENRFARGVNVHATRPLAKLRAATEAVHCGRTAGEFAAFLDDVHPDVLHFHNIYGRLTTSILGEARKRGIPAVLTVHDYKLVCPSYLMLRNGKPCTACLDGGYYRCAVYKCHKQNRAASIVYSAEAYRARFSDSYGAISAFLCPSRFIADLLVKSGIDPARVVYQPNCVDPDAYNPAYEGQYVLYTGRLSHEKGIETLVDAVAGTDIPLRIAGSGPMEDVLRNKTTQRGQTNVIFEGHCGGDKLAELYRNAAFVAVPSEWYENAPMSVLEAFAYGKPAVATAIGGLPELVVNGRTGYLVQPGDTNALRSMILLLWGDPESRRQMGRNARGLVEGRLSQDHRITSLIGLYRNLLETGGRLAQLDRLVSIAS